MRHAIETSIQKSPVSRSNDTRKHLYVYKALFMLMLFQCDEQKNLPKREIRNGEAATDFRQA